MLPSGSDEPEPPSVTLSPDETLVLSAVAMAVGGWLSAGFSIVTATVSVSMAPSSSVTISVKTRVTVSVTSGAVNVGFSAAGFDNGTVLPVVSVWVHSYDSMFPSESDEPEPSRLTNTPVLTL